MKIDIEGHERRAFTYADRLFDSVKVDYIFMEWITLRESVLMCSVVFLKLKRVIIGRL